MTSHVKHCIVVGVDGSPASDAALDWAAAEAVRRRRRLHLCGVGERELPGGDAAMYVTEILELAETDAVARAEAALDAAAARVSERWPGLEFTRESVLGNPAGVLVEHSAHAESIVLGHRGHGVIVGALLGSVAHQVAAHASCPVVVVRTSGAGATAPGTTFQPDPEVLRTGGVVVGVDGSAGSEEAVGYAFDEAAVRGCDLHVVKAWWTSTAGLSRSLKLDFQNAERLAASETLVGWADKYPDVTVHVTVPMAPTVASLVRAGTGAELLVVGNRGLGGFRRLLLGSVSHGVLQHATCPVAIVRNAESA
ncbi:universal stress protein [Nocardioides psychrotolerans]|uniref:Nucleotide-binding universal stress protein, UspA family n=1 Tax=Nocardioides psychrotolerans TaxID=1005945 RepID=A0A1I3QX29_9ACTN|nr:universal stress protein [Nocardioides psychrotolerans]GEP40260.1 universal stress protein [Nocardioides psychrotolerans]SFJ38783.1 Nucleotide-binding universal stress protein, UspA family [Nocardioides psychrotolerans]